MNKDRPLQGTKVLVIEDDYFLADDLSRALQACGAIVIGPLASLSAALRRIKGDGFEAVVVDLKLRDELAYPLADELRSRGIPFVFSTGYPADDIPSRFAGIPRCEKPFEEHILIAALEEVLAPQKN